MLRRGRENSPQRKRRCHPALESLRAFASGPHGFGLAPRSGNRRGRTPPCRSPRTLPFGNTCLTGGYHYLFSAALSSFCRAQARLGGLSAVRAEGTRKAFLT